jgi:choline dehydrogenase-like flavoprotein
VTERSSTDCVDCEYIVVGSGAGGGTVAARLAEAGATVTLLEAGADPRELVGGDPVTPTVNRLPADYDVPAFHAFASENEAMKWDYFVRHCAEQSAPEKYRSDMENGGRGVLYPRAGALGGCTAHNAMIFVYPHNSDWDLVADLTGDESWRPDKMRAYFEKIERCEHRPLQRWLARIGFNPSRHGWKGWLSIQKALPMVLLENRVFGSVIADEVRAILEQEGQPMERIGWFFESGLDPNDWRLVRDNATGIRYLPLSTCNRTRVGTRERVLDVAQRYPERLKIVLNALVTRVLLDDNRRAMGVEYLHGERLYRAHANPNLEPRQSATLRASREVILAAGAFNTPQLLMLSGIGPRTELNRHSIPVLVDLPGVGKNLQDRYEVGVVNRMNFKRWAAYDGATFSTRDRQFADWEAGKGGIYSTNGSVLTLFRRSSVAEQVPDLFCMSLLAKFTGYRRNYSREIADKLNYLTWVVLKGHTRNRAGEVTLRSADPRDTPLVDFKYFHDGGEEDLTAVVDGIRFVRRVSERLRASGMIEAEEVPGPGLQSDDELKAFVRANAWGHHASCTCPIGAVSANGVLASDFRVHHTTGLRVVDASVFPRIPGFFIASAIYMIGEKAAEVILAERRT